MKYFYWFKGFIFIALACSVTAQGSTVVSSGSKASGQDETSPAYNLSVSSGQVQNAKASANLTISGENSKVNVEKPGTVTLVAGKSIVLHPGTKISKGSFLYASIEPRSKGGKQQKKEARLVTIEEKQKIEEQASFSYAASLFSPFPARGKGMLHAGDAENGSYHSSNIEISGVSPEQQRKVAVDSRSLPQASRTQILTVNHPIPVDYSNRTQIMMVLRL